MRIEDIKTIHQVQLLLDKFNLRRGIIQVNEMFYHLFPGEIIDKIKGHNVDFALNLDTKEIILYAYPDSWDNNPNEAFSYTILMPEELTPKIVKIVLAQYKDEIVTLIHNRIDRKILEDEVEHYLDTLGILNYIL
jgi:hypothetical protein